VFVDDADIFGESVDNSAQGIQIEKAQVCGDDGPEQVCVVIDRRADLKCVE